jgi:hypothetical protein
MEAAIERPHKPQTLSASLVTQPRYGAFFFATEALFCRAKERLRLEREGVQDEGAGDDPTQDQSE